MRSIVVVLLIPLAPSCVNEIGTFVLSTVFCTSLYRSYCFFANEVGFVHASSARSLTRSASAMNEQECALVFPTMQMGKYTPLRERLPQSVYLAMYRGFWSTVRCCVPLVVFLYALLLAAWLTRVYGLDLSLCQVFMLVLRYFLGDEIVALVAWTHGGSASVCQSPVPMSQLVCTVWLVTTQTYLYWDFSSHMLKIFLVDALHFRQPPLPQLSRTSVR